MSADDARRDSMVLGLGVEAGLRRFELGTIELPADVAVYEPGLLALSNGKSPRARAALDAPCVPGNHEVVAYDREKLALVAVIVRRPAAVVTAWRPLRRGFDAHVLIAPADLTVAVSFPGRAHPDAQDARAWVHHGKLDDQRPFLWIEDPAGLGRVRAHAGLDALGRAAALCVELD